MVLTLLTKLLAIYVKATIIQVGVLGLEDLILGCRVCFTIFLAFNKHIWSQFGSFLQVYIGIYIKQTISESEDLSRKKHENITTFNRNAFSKLIFFNKNGVVASMWTGHFI